MASLVFHLNLLQSLMLNALKAASSQPRDSETAFPLEILSSHASSCQSASNGGGLLRPSQRLLCLFRVPSRSFDVYIARTKMVGRQRQAAVTAASKTATIFCVVQLL